MPRLSLGICEEEGCPLGRGEPSLAGDRLVPTRVLRSLASAARDPRVSLGHQRAGPKDGITAPPISIFLTNWLLLRVFSKFLKDKSERSLA